MLNFNSLNALVKEKVVKPSDMEFIYFLFYEKGIDFVRFNEQPIPYILSILNVADYRRKMEEMESKKSKFRK